MGDHAVEPPGAASVARSVLARPDGSPWSPRTWLRILVWRWRLYGPVTPAERRGYWFWGLTVAFVLLIELLAALSETLDDFFPWPTISSTVGDLEKRWDWVGVIVVGAIAIAAFQAVGYRSQRRRDTGRTYRSIAGDPAGLPPPSKDWSRYYMWWYVVVLEAVVITLAVLLVDDRFERGCIIYGVLGFFGILLPGMLAFWANRIVGFPTLLTTVNILRHRVHLVAVVVVAGLAVLTVHLAFYPWPDTLRESASFAGLSPYQARVRAEQALKAIAPGTWQYSLQEKDVVDGHDAWSVYFRATSGTGPACVVAVAKGTTSPSDTCSG